MRTTWRTVGADPLVRPAALLSAAVACVGVAYGAQTVFDSLLTAGFSPELADDYSQEIAKELFSTQDMTHNPDIIFGGPDFVVNFGDASANRSIGNLMKKEAEAFEAWLRTQDPDAIVNLRIKWIYTGQQQKDDSDKEEGAA